MHRFLIGILCFVSLAAVAQQPQATQPTLQGCPAPIGADLPDLPPADPDDPRVEVLTGRAALDLDAGTVFSEPLQIRRGSAILSAPAARYDKATGTFTMSGGLEYRDTGVSVSGKAAEFDVNQSRLTFEGAEFEIYSVPARGSAGQVKVERMQTLDLDDVTYTTCSRGKEDWLLRAEEIEIDRESGTGTARHARLEFKGVPILYTPWFTYPVTDQRKSGFLLPSIGSAENRGLELTTPYYFNIAPNYDATLTPRYMSERGLELISQFRYLGSRTGGQLDAEYLEDDEKTSESRYLVGATNQTMLGYGWRATAEARAVSDTSYFEDLYSGVAATSQTNLERVLALEYFDEIWAVLTRFQDFQNLDSSLAPTEKAYRRVPQIAASAHVPDGVLGLDWGLISDLSVFDRNTGVTGTRLHLSPTVSLPLRYKGFWIEPAVAGEYTGYSLHNAVAGEDERPSRSTPIISTDVGTVLERIVPGGSGWLQTLEPHAQYVYIPYRDQDDLPVFDTIEPDFNLVQLFRKNQFLGYDRLGNTSELNVGVTSRLIDGADGTQFLTATVGQSRFFRAQDVTLPGGQPIDNNASDWLAELAMNFWGNWKMDLGWQWDTDQSESRRAEASLRYRRDGEHAANLSYRYQRDELEEAGVSVVWPLADRWSAVGRYAYSILDDQMLETYVGLEYQNCCWGLRLIYRDYLASRDGESENSIGLQLLLKGLTDTTPPADRLREHGILDSSPY